MLCAINVDGDRDSSISGETNDEAMATSISVYDIFNNDGREVRLYNPMSCDGMDLNDIERTKDDLPLFEGNLCRQCGHLGLYCLCPGE